MAQITKLWIAQTRWLGGDDWTNNVYVGFSREDVEAQIVATANEDVQAEIAETGEDLRLYASLEQLVNDNGGEFLVDIYEEVRVTRVQKSEGLSPADQMLLYFMGDN